MTNTERSCGDCAACCKTHAVVELKKSDGTWCAYCSSRKRCDIYDERPASCREFRCAWLKGSGGEDERPDKTRIVCTTEAVPYRGRIVHWCTMVEVSVGALERPYAAARIASLVREGWVVEVFDHDLRRQTFVLPQTISKAELPLVMRELEKLVPALELVV